MDSQFGDVFSEGFDVTWISGGQTLNSGLDSCSGSNVVQGVEPLRKQLSLPNFSH